MIPKRKHHMLAPMGESRDPLMSAYGCFPRERVTRMDGSRLSPLSYAHIFAGEFGDRLYTSPRDSGEREGPNASALGG